MSVHLGRLSGSISRHWFSVVSKKHSVCGICMISWTASVDFIHFSLCLFLSVGKMLVRCLSSSVLEVSWWYQVGFLPFGLRPAFFLIMDIGCSLLSLLSS